MLGGIPVFLAWYGIGVALVLIENEDFVFTLFCGLP